MTNVYLMASKHLVLRTDVQVWIDSEISSYLSLPVTLSTHEFCDKICGRIWSAHKVIDALKATRNFPIKQTESGHHCGWNRIKLHPKPHPTKDILYWFVSKKFIIKPSVNWKQWRNQCNEQSTSEATDWQWEHIKDSFQRKGGNYWNFAVFKDIVVLSLSWWGPGSPVLVASLCLQSVGKT